MTDAAKIESAPPPKIEPATLTIRGRPLRAIRFRRGMIVGLVAFVVLFIIVVAWLALKPRVLHAAIEADTQDQPAKTPTDTLAGAPSSYADVPKLGPPLPGDLGKPILDRERELGADTGAAAAPLPDRSATAAAQAEQAEQERQLAALKAARESGLLFQSGVRVTNPLGSAADAAGATVSDGQPANHTQLDPDRDPNAQEHKAAFVAATDKDGDINPHTQAPAPSPFTLSAGSVIAGSLITGLRSDLPGLVIAQVTQNVYDTATGQILLIPQGARLIGTYDSVVAFGQKRALVVWQRILFPDTSSVRIDNAPATDSAGYAGLEDKVDFHTWSLLKGVVLSTVLGIGPELALSGQSDLVQALRLSTQTNVSRAGDMITQRNLQIQPSISIRPGANVRLVVHRDLILAPWKG